MKNNSRCLSVFWRQGESYPFGHLSYFHPFDLMPGFHVDDGNVIAVGIADASIFSVGCEYDPVWSGAGSHPSCNFLCLYIVDIHAIVEQAGYPEFTAIRRECQAMSEGVRRFVLQRG